VRGSPSRGRATNWSRRFEGIEPRPPKRIEDKLANLTNVFCAEAVMPEDFVLITMLPVAGEPPFSETVEPLHDAPATAGEKLHSRRTSPENPFAGMSVTRAVPDWPGALIVTPGMG
jgi:hypothetical protein